MNSGMISMRYARALFEYALEQKVEDTLFQEMTNVASAFKQNRSLQQALNNPVLGSDDKLGLMKSAVGKSVSDTYLRFAQLLLRQKRENYLETISLVYADLYRKHKNINVGRLVTAAPVDSEVIEKMKTFLQKRQQGTLEFESTIDPSIGGGFVLYIDTYRLDASVATQLKQIRAQLVDRNTKVV